MTNDWIFLLDSLTCWSVDLGLPVKSGLKVGESDSRVMSSLAIGS